MSNTTNTAVTAMLVSLSFKFGRQGGEDEEMTNELCQKHNAKSTDVKGTKRVICKEAYEPLQKLKNEFRGAVSRVTIPWDIKGVYFCKPAAVPKIVLARDTYGPEFEELKQNHLLGQYETWKTMTKEKLGTAFKEDEFPSREDLVMHVHYKMAIMPLPESEALRKIKDIDESLMAELIKSNDERIKKGISQGMIVAYNRLMEPLQKMTSVLTSEKPRIFETLVTNVQDIISVIPSLNLTDDPHLAQFASKAKELIGSISAEKLRDDKVLRKETADKAASLLATFGQVGVRKFAA